MFIKLTRAGGHTYAQLVESFRDEHGKPRQRTVATLGRVDEDGGQVDALLNGLLRSKGRPAATGSTPQLRFESALALGDVWALHELWHELGFDRLAASLDGVPVGENELPRADRGADTLADATARPPATNA